MKETKCKYCNKNFKYYLQTGGRDRQFCSMKCYGLSKLGKTLAELIGKSGAEIVVEKSRRRCKNKELINENRVLNLGEYAKKGNKPWNKGKQMPKEFGEKIRQRNLKNPSRYWFGKKRPELTGENHHNWKGGISSFDRLERVRFRRTIQKQVLERDNYTCQICGQYNGNLQVDHIQLWSEYIEGRFDINNCRTLCIKCHYKITFGKDMPKGIITWGHNLPQFNQGEQI